MNFIKEFPKIIDKWENYLTLLPINFKYMDFHYANINKKPNDDFITINVKDKEYKVYEKTEH